MFLVRRLADSGQVVIKQIPVDDLGKDERFAALNEVKVLSMLQHPNIIAYYDNFVDEKSLMIVMEYAPGGTLHEFIQERNGVLLDEDVCVLECWEHPCSEIFIYRKCPLFWRLKYGVYPYREVPLHKMRY